MLDSQTQKCSAEAGGMRNGFVFAWFLVTPRALFSRPSLQISRYVKCHSDCRFGIFNLVIADWIKFQNYEDFDPIEANNQFIRTYNAIPDRDVLFQNVNEFPEELQVS